MAYRDIEKRRKATRARVRRFREAKKPLRMLERSLPTDVVEMIKSMSIERQRVGLPGDYEGRLKRAAKNHG